MYSATIRWEAMQIDGRTYMYFGLWPALLRIPLNWLAPEKALNWARLWLATSFEGGRHARRVDRIEAYDKSRGPAQRA